jgi:hypothetical protein
MRARVKTKGDAQEASLLPRRLERLPEEFPRDELLPEDPLDRAPELEPELRPEDDELLGRPAEELWPRLLGRLADELPLRLEGALLRLEGALLDRVAEPRLEEELPDRAPESRLEGARLDPLTASRPEPERPLLEEVREVERSSELLPLL